MLQVVLINIVRLQMSSAEYKLERFDKLHIQEYLEFCYESYVVSNPFVRDHVTRAQLDKGSVVILTAFIEAAEAVNRQRGTDVWFNTFIRVGGRMAIASFSAEARYYFDVLVREGYMKTLSDWIPGSLVEELKEGQGVMNARVAVRKEFHGSGIFDYSQKERARFLMRAGYEYHLAQSLMPKTEKYVRKRGSVCHVLNGVFYGHEVKFVFMKTRLADIVNYVVPPSKL